MFTIFRAFIFGLVNWTIKVTQDYSSIVTNGLGGVSECYDLCNLFRKYMRKDYFHFIVYRNVKGKEQNLNANCHFINDNQSYKNKEALQHAIVPWAEHRVLTEIVKLLSKDFRDLHNILILYFFIRSHLTYPVGYLFNVGFVFDHCNLITKEMVGSSERLFNRRDLLLVKLIVCFI